jgi:hypothetical protein
MARRVFFSFHFETDIWRVNQVRMCNVVAGVDQAGFFDHSEYEEAKRKSSDVIAKMIRRRLEGTTVTIVLIGTETADRPWVKREVELSLEQKNGLLGIHIHHLTLLIEIWTEPSRREEPRLQRATRENTRRI